jgi:hypothetical protein
MPETVTVNEELGIVEIRSFGKVTREDLARTVDQVERVRREIGTDRVLVDLRGQESLPGTLDLFAFGAEVLPRTLRVAGLVCADQATIDDLRFGESVARNRGAELRLFDSFDEALAWLRC